MASKSGIKGRITESTKRTYKTIIDSPWRTRLQQILASSRPLYMVKLDTSGLDPVKDRIIGMVISRNHFEDDKLICDDVFSTLVMPEEGFEIPDEISKINFITNEMLKNKGMEFHAAMKQAVEFLGENTNITGFCTKNFIGPFLTNEVKRAGLKLSMKYSFDMLHMAEALIPATSPKYRASYFKTAQRLGVDPNTGMKGYLNVFNILYSRIPNGIIPMKIRGDKYWEKSFSNRYVDLKTDCGIIRFNCYNLCFEEVVAGSFDTVDLDAFTQYIFAKQHCNSMYEFSKRYDGKSKFVGSREAYYG